MGAENFDQAPGDDLFFAGLEHPGASLDTVGTPAWAIRNRWRIKSIQKGSPLTSRLS
jgi:hypothetical protein